MPKIDILLATLNHKSKTASLALFSPLFLSTLLSICSWIFRLKLGSYTNYNHEFQPEINLFLEIKSPSQIKTKSCLLGIKNKKRSGAKAEL